MNLIFRNFRG